MIVGERLAIKQLFQSFLWDVSPHATSPGDFTYLSYQSRFQHTCHASSPLLSPTENPVRNSKTRKVPDIYPYPYPHCHKASHVFVLGSRPRWPVQVGCIHFYRPTDQPASRRSRLTQAESQPSQIVKATGQKARQSEAKQSQKRTEQAQCVVLPSSKHQKTRLPTARHRLPPACVGPQSARWLHVIRGGDTSSSDREECTNKPPYNLHPVANHQFGQTALVKAPPGLIPEE